jgi:hypothetical protein
MNVLHYIVCILARISLPVLRIHLCTACSIILESDAALVASRAVVRGGDDMSLAEQSISQVGRGHGRNSGPLS